MFPQEGMPLHVGRRLHPDQTQQSGRKIDEADQTIGLASCLVILRSQVLVFLRDVKNQGYIETAVVGPSLASRHTGAMISVIKNDGLL